MMPSNQTDSMESRIARLSEEIAAGEREMRAEGASQRAIDDFKTQKRFEMYEMQGGQPQNTYDSPVGIGTLNETARNMFRGPRGIGGFEPYVEEYADGGMVDLSEYRNKLYGSESSYDPTVERTDNAALGLSQAMPETLEEFKDQTGLEFSRDEYKNNVDLQLAFQDWYEQKTLNYVVENGLDQYIGKVINGVPITLSSMLGMAHLGGDYGMRRFIETGGRYNPADAEGTRLSDYGRKFANLNIYNSESLPEGTMPSDEEILMSMPVETDEDFYDPLAYSVRPKLRPETTYAPETSIRPQARPEEYEEETFLQLRPGVIQPRPQKLYEKYGGAPTGIASLEPRTGVFT